MIPGAGVSKSRLHSNADLFQRRKKNRGKIKNDFMKENQKSNRIFRYNFTLP